MTAAEYIALPNDERWCELIDGVVVVNEPRVDHGLVSIRLSYALQHWTQQGTGRGYVLPPVDVDTAAESVIVQRRSKPDVREFDVALELSGDDELTSPQLPGFALRVADIFRDIP